MVPVGQGAVMGVDPKIRKSSDIPITDLDWAEQSERRVDQLLWSRQILSGGHWPDEYIASLPPGAAEGAEQARTPR